MKKFNMNLPEDLHRRLKHYCVDHDTQMGAVVRRLIEIFLEEQKKKPKRK
jgi:hypothetical protein